MVVDPLLHGQGIGSACLNAALSATEAHVFLSTQLQRNVDFYRRIGFAVVHDQFFGTAADEFGFRSWWMFRPSANVSAIKAIEKWQRVKPSARHRAASRPIDSN
jgi:GNAT superfamily N-acetyltransferase